ncbi:MAG: DUF2169 domain-containing protein [Chitinophagaceae bacterium]|nr:DUF2169 domain-containing protein [Bacteroidota bacterium]MCC6257497.1 DUF2169 domain-containing protein [Chitinophagaceae bacterium]MCW5916237.1 DUF2169 domain-containing protein [Ferruginibacter sp.]
MDLINHTPFPSIMFRAGIDDNKYAMSVATRVTYDISGNSIQVSEDQQAWAPQYQAVQTKYGFLESDYVYRRGAVDILVMGNAKAPNNSPVPYMEVEVHFNKKRIHRIAIFGNRKWEKTIFGTAISTPEPFTEMPLILENAFGGMADWDGVKLPFQNNPSGKGYYFSKEDSLNNPLPNIEDPNCLIKKWSDQPDPTGVCSTPQLSELHARNNVSFDDQGKVTKYDPKFYNTAFPAMLVDKVIPGDTLDITGMGDQAFSFRIPSCELVMKVSMNERFKEWPMYIEQVGLIVDEQKAFITYRYPINYIVTPMETRTCEIIQK